MTTIDLIVPDISCDHCKHTIETGLGELAGVSSVLVDVEARSVHVELDGAGTDEASLRAELAELGYPPA